MRKMNTILSVVVSITFFVNNLAFSDIVSKNIVPEVFSGNKLAAESRLEPMATPEFLDIAKLTAQLIALSREDRIRTFFENKDTDTETADVEKYIDAISPQQNRNTCIKRDPDGLQYYFRNKTMLEDKSAMLIPCSINGIAHGKSKSDTRWYICCVKYLSLIHI